MDVISPKLISSLHFDYIIIAVTRIAISEAIKKELLELGIEERRIALIDTNLLTEENLPEGLKS